MALGLVLSGCGPEGYTPRASASAGSTITPSTPLPGDIKALTIKEENKSKQKKSDTKAEDVKTFDFQKIFAQANEYYNAAIKWKKLKCAPKTAFVCTKKECPKVQVKENSYIILDKKKDVVSLCRDGFCNNFPAKFEQTGVFVNVQIQDLVGMYIKILGDSRYKEISVIGLDSYITNGECTVM